MPPKEGEQLWEALLISSLNSQFCLGFILNRGDFGWLAYFLILSFYARILGWVYPYEFTQAFYMVPKCVGSLGEVQQSNPFKLSWINYPLFSLYIWGTKKVKIYFLAL
jgi:SNF family Na+-dependent transporter